MKMKTKVFICSWITAAVVAMMFALLEKLSYWLATEFYRMFTWFTISLIAQLIAYHFVFERREK